jgi:hypothetical protein
MSDLWYRKNHVMIAALAVVLAGLLLVITSEVPAYVSASTSSPITSNMLAAGGPLPGNLSLLVSEQECINSLQNETTWAPWYPTMANTEHGGSERAGV